MARCARGTVSVDQARGLKIQLRAAAMILAAPSARTLHAPSASAPDSIPSLSGLLHGGQPRRTDSALRTKARCLRWASCGNLSTCIESTTVVAWRSNSVRKYHETL